MTITLKWVVIFFGIFFIAVGILMLFSPRKARAYIGKAGSTNFINYAEITIRMIPAAGLVLYADFSKYPDVFSIAGWFMIATSLVLYFVPRKLHHSFAVMCAERLKPVYIRVLSPITMLTGCAIIYAVV